ncbi:MAG: family 78 glycoside hydrolase catalytic domain [Clostridia bacterium]|nr:family 78 glycoside hydrolase catalytic domain [Clostridia bacterium]
MLLKNSKWICYPAPWGEGECPVFRKAFNTKGELKRATLKISSLGCYYAELGGKRIGDFILAPGWTFYKRAQVQCYDVTDLIDKDNELRVTVGGGWFKGRINERNRRELPDKRPALICELELAYKNGDKEYIYSDESWQGALGKLTFSDIYDGEHFDANLEEQFGGVQVQDCSFVTLVPQQGEKIVEQETIRAHRIFKTPKGETIIDFNQNLTGYFELELEAKKGERVSLSFAEVLDKDGNFYTENYRSAKAELEYICKDGKQSYKPRLAFWGFRYIRVNSFPAELTLDSIRAIVLHSDIKRTGELSSSSPLLNKLFKNIFWGQKGNFLDIPTDCPQRDERLGWTGDAQVFVRTASYNYDVEKFFDKWLEDLRLEQQREGLIPFVVPQVHERPGSSTAAWSDAATVCPWQIYQTYGNKKILKRQFKSMCDYIEEIGRITKEKYLWYGCWHFGDWLGLDAPAGSYVGSSSLDLIGTAFYAYSTSLVVKAGRVLGRNVQKYERLYEKIIEKARRTFTEYKTQTECTLALCFNLTDNKKEVARQLADMIRANGKRLQTGFVGTPYLLHALSQNGYTELAYDLLLQENYPSWLYSVKQGATTVWEHWDGINDKGEFWSRDMNSFNHYAYGSVADWVYGVACGIQIVEDKPAFEEIVIAPQPTKRLDWLSAKIKTRNGEVSSAWYKEGDTFRYEITTPAKTTIIIDGVAHVVEKGTYVF